MKRTRQADQFVQLPEILAELGRQDSRVDQLRHPEAIKTITVRPWIKMPAFPISRNEQFVSVSGLRLLTETDVVFGGDITYVHEGVLAGNEDACLSKDQFKAILEQSGSQGQAVLHNLSKLTRRRWWAADRTEWHSFTVVAFVTKVTNPLVGLVGCWIDLYPVPNE